MGTIATSTSSSIFVYSNAEKLVRDSGTGHLWAAIVNASGNLELYRSTNNGSSWGLITTKTRASVQEWGNIVAHNNWVHIVYRTNESSQDRIYHDRYNITGDWWDDELQYHMLANGGVAGSKFQGCFVMQMRYSGWDWIVVAGGYVEGSDAGVYLASGTINTSTDVELLDNSKLSKRKLLIAGQSGPQRPALIQPSASSKHFWVALGRTKVALTKCVWNGNGWNVGNTPVINTGTFATTAVNCRWDGGHIVMAVPNDDSTALDKVAVWERNEANTTTTKRLTQAHPQGAIKYVTIATDIGTQDLRVYAIGTTTNVLYYCSYDRSANTWTAWAQVVATAVLGENFGVRSYTYNTAKYDVYAAHSGAPNTAVHYQQGLAFPPDAPTWNGATGTSGEARNVSASLLLDWDFHDIDPTDTQSAYAVARKIGAGAFAYWRASDSTWQAGEVQNTSATTSLTLASGWGVGTDAAHTYQVKTWDSTATAGPYGEVFSVIPSVLVNPTMSLPTADQVIGTPQLTVTWTVSEQSKYRIVVSPNPNPDAVSFYDSGWVVSTSLTHTVPFVLDNKSAYTVTLQTANNEGLASTVQSRNFTTDFVAPGTPSVVLTPLPASGVMRVALTNPVANPITFVGTGAADSGSSGSRTPALPAGLQHDDAMYCFASTRNSGTGTVASAGSDWIFITSFGNMAILGKLYRAGDVAPTVTFNGGAANEDTIAQIVAFRGASLMRSGNATVLNGSAQNIAYPSLTVTLNNQLVIVLGWKQDDWTSVATAGFAGAVEIGEPVSTAGNDAGQVWDYAIQTTAANITGSSFTVTGGLSAISRGITLTMAPKANFVSQDLYRRKVGDLDDGIRVAAGVAEDGTYDDYTAISGVAYEYRSLVFSDTGSQAYGPWTA